MAVELIQSLSYAKINEIISFQRNSDGSVLVEVTGWTDIPMNPASGEFSYTSRTDSAGISYTTSVGARLREHIGAIPECILKIILCSGRVLILGTPFVPVRGGESRSLTLNRLGIEHYSVDPAALLVI